jgi:hypothetical protein
MIERRKHKRYTMPRGTLAILRGRLGRLRNHGKMQIGEIAMVLYKSKASVIGQVGEISLGGLSINVDPAPVLHNSDDELDLLMTEQGIYLHNVPYLNVPTRRCGEGSTVALRFGELNDEHQGQLRELLTHHVG